MATYSSVTPSSLSPTDICFCCLLNHCTIYSSTIYAVAAMAPSLCFLQFIKYSIDNGDATASVCLMVGRKRVQARRKARAEFFPP